jgi:hypothetical protein
MLTFHDGALSRLDTDDKVAALAEIEQALDKLQTVTGVDVSDLMQLLALAANSVAQTTFDDAVSDAGQTPHPERAGQAPGGRGMATRRCPSAPGLREFTDAVRAFRFATTRALEALEA